MKPNVDLSRYSEFVAAVTSAPSNNLNVMIDRIRQLELDGFNMDVNLSLLLTASIGLGAETGEFSEIVKKILFQGKPLDHDSRYHMMRELGDVAWYWVNAVRAIGADPNEIIAMNVQKLEARYPGGKFSVEHSENRVKGDI